MFGEAVAILAGDALLTLAFELDRGQRRRGDRARGGGCEVVGAIADAAGTDGMVGGQVVDIESEGKAISAEMLEYIHRHKTAALIRASLRVGALLVGGRRRRSRPSPTAGQSLGLAFQIVDDILDVEGSLAELGKTAGSDERKQKATYPALHGLDDLARRGARADRRGASACSPPLGPAAEPIRALADFVVERRS